MIENEVHLLPDAIANQIAAGEVVQRPSSVVKELLENSIDSGSTEIKLIIKNSGKTLIQVLDNGKGMSEIDCRMAFERHATSKIKTAEDLLNIKTMGFRGEALASIAAVAQVSACTTTNSKHLGTKIIIEGSKVISQEAEPATKGIKISVKNLFYNVPARRNFLKSDSVETKHIIDEFLYVALSHSNIAFFMYNDKKEVFHLPKTNILNRIINIFGKSYKDNLIVCKEDTEYIKINGFIGAPEHAKKTRGEQFFFVNKRYIRSAYLNHAVKSAFSELIDRSQFPFYILFLQINPECIDINVHPSKAEIKFDDEKLVYSILLSAVKKSISKFHKVPSIDFDKDINSGEIKMLEKAQERNRIKNEYISFKNYDRQNKDYAWDKLLDIQENSVKDSNKGLGNIGHFHEEKSISKKESKENHDAKKINSGSFFTNIELENNVYKTTKKIQVGNRFIITQIKTALIIIYQDAAHERILYEKYLDIFKGSKTISKGSQQLLFPSIVSINKSDLELLKNFYKELSSIGFKINFKDNDPNNSFVEILGLPSDIIVQNPQQLIESFLEQYKNNASLSLDKHAHLARSLAKRTSIGREKRLSNEEISSITDMLFDCKNPKYTPNGQPTFIEINFEDLSDMFKQTV